MVTPRRLLLLSLYYPPDLSACAFRSAALVSALREVEPGLSVDVLTSLPNRYKSFVSAAPEVETDGQVTIRRLPMPAHRSDMRTQAQAYATFARSVTRRVRASETSYDLIVATSSRLMTAALGSWVSRRTGVPLYLDIRDLFVDTIGDILPGRMGAMLAPVLSQVESFTMRRASHINLVSPGFQAYFQDRYPQTPLTFFTNGIDEEFIRDGVEAQPHRAAGPKTVVYAGNIGEGQGLHAILPGLAGALTPDVRFKVIGDGGRRPQLVEALAAAGITTVELLPPMPRARLIDQYLDADALFLHLHGYDAFTRVLPSKVFEYGAIGKPVWAGVAGVAASFLREHVRSAAVFPPCDVEAGVRAWRELDLTPTSRPEFIAKFRRTTVAREMAAHILSVMR